MPNGPREHEYDLRRFPSKYNGKCRGCGEFYSEGETVLWGKPGGKSVTYHDNPDCVPRSLTFDPSGGQQVPRSHTEPDPETPDTATGGHARHDPDADTMAGTRLLLDKLIGIEAQLVRLGNGITNIGAKVTELADKLENAPF